MADLVRLAYYPFLPEVRDAVRELGPDMGQVLESPIYEGVRRRAVHRVEGALADQAIPPRAITDERGALQELLSVAVARMLLVLLGDRTLVRRYAHAEAVRAEATLLQDPDSLAEVADALDVKVRRDADAWRIHFADYLAVAPVHQADWKLISRPVDRGWVPLSEPSVTRLCREALERRIEAELEQERGRPVHDEVERALGRYAEELKPKLEKAREDWNTGDFGPVQKGLFPPCMKKIFADMKGGELVPHHGRFAVASFLGTIGMTADDILDYFREIPNFDPDKSRYQIEHITGERGVDPYTPPGCATMQSQGICPLDLRDGLCAKIKHPLSYYRAKIRFQKKDEMRRPGDGKDAEQDPEAGEGRTAPDAAETPAPGDGQASPRGEDERVGAGRRNGGSRQAAEARHG